MRWLWDDIIGKHKGFPGIICGHGPSLGKNKDKIEKAQAEGLCIRLSVNDWYNFLTSPPTYWVICNKDLAVQNHYGTFNKYGVPLLFSDAEDQTPFDTVDSVLTCDYFSFDQRHWKGHSCKTMYQNYQGHLVNGGSNDNCLLYGNNPYIFKGPKEENTRALAQYSRCCGRIQPDRLTVQEQLQQLSSHPQHPGGCESVAQIALMLAVIMGCNPIFIAGVDFSPNYLVDWVVFADSIKNDNRIIYESAKNMKIDVINLNEQEINL